MRISLLVKGGNSFQKHIANQTVDWCMKKLMPNIKRIYIELAFKNIPDADGYCENSAIDSIDFVGSSPRYFKIQVDKRLHFMEMVSTIIHEMVHVKQYVYRELSDNASAVKWKSKACSYGMSYEDQPWEKEAFRLQDRLLSPLLTEVEFSTNVDRNGFAKTPLTTV